MERKYIFYLAAKLIKKYNIYNKIDNGGLIVFNLICEERLIYYYMILLGRFHYQIDQLVWL